MLKSYKFVTKTTFLLIIYKRNIKIVTHKKYKSKGLVRVLSLFNTGLTLFKRAINSRIYIRIPMKFILYDI